MPEIELAGCAPVPLASYLKALGIFRLLAEQKDQKARGFWRREIFLLDTALTKEKLVGFFLDEYRPSPILSPWNNGSGFYLQEGKTKEKDPATGKLRKTGVRDEETQATRIVGDLAKTEPKERLALYRDAIVQTRSVLGALGWNEAPADDKKRDLVMHLRARLPEACLPWLDAAIALTGETLGFPPLLGSGGNDGRLDFSANFMLRLAEVIDPKSGISKPGARAPLEVALFGGAAPILGNEGAIGQFAPGAAGGPNATVGFERETLINPWDYILMLEGVLLFAASATRRLGPDAGPDSLSYPFTVRMTSVAGGGAAVSDESDARGEVWLPLWDRPATYTEISSLLSEGRATVGRRPARDGVDFARAAVTLGVDRGVTEFQRFGFLQRSGRSYVAVPMSRVSVRPNPKADLLNDLDRHEWLLRLRRFARNAQAPTQLQSLALQLDDAIFRMTQEASPQAVQRVLVTLGRVVAYLASSPKARDPKEGNQKPPPRLSRGWYEAANDGSAEFRIAAALAGMGHALEYRDRSGPAGDADSESEKGQSNRSIAAEDASAAEEGHSGPPPFCAHLAPLDEKTWHQRCRQWGDPSGLQVWHFGSLERNLAAVAERRLIFAVQRMLDGGPFDGRAPADLFSVLSFLQGETDDEKIAGLVQGLAWANAPDWIDRKRTEPRPLLLAYALIKPFFASINTLRGINGVPEDLRLPVPAGLIARLRSGDVAAAMTLACRRARGSGLPIAFEPCSKSAADSGGMRLLAALLIPILPADLKRVWMRAYPDFDLFEEDQSPIPKENHTDAA